MVCDDRFEIIADQFHIRWYADDIILKALVISRALDDDRMWEKAPHHFGKTFLKEHMVIELTGTSANKCHIHFLHRIFVSAVTIASTSSIVLYRPKLIRIVPFAYSSGTLSALITWDI